MSYFSAKSQIHYSDSGGTNAPVIFLHGLGSRGTDWQPQIDALNDKYRVITLDFPGHGKSEAWHAPITVKDLAGIAKMLLDQLKIPSAHFIGLSLGGMVAFQMAVDYPECLRSMVIINSAPGPGANPMKFKMRLLLRKALLRFVGIDKLAQRIAHDLFPQSSQASLRDQFLASIKYVDKQTYKNIVDAIGNFNLDKAIRGCHIPALILAADQDYTSITFKENYTKRMKNARICVIPNSRHASPLDSPEFCNREIVEFLKQLEK
jgi:pimeloyl-ACP methyl ester carboxylesterase